MRRVRVLELIKGLDVGGAEKLLCQRMQRSDHVRFQYFVGYVDGRRAALEQELPAEVPSVCLSRSGVYDPRWLIRLRGLICGEAIDIVHVHSPLVAAATRLVVRTLGSSRPAVVTTEHSIHYHWATTLLNQLTISGDDMVFAVSSAVARGRACRAAKRVEVVKHGVDILALRAHLENRVQLKREFALNPGTNVVTVANLRTEKGYATLLSAAALVHRDYPDVHFYSAGAGPLENRDPNRTATDRSGWLLPSPGASAGRGPAHDLR